MNNTSNVENGFELDQLDTIADCSLPLRGRYLWTTLYIDHLKALKSEGRHLDTATIRTAANDIANRAKKDLKDRLSRLHSHSSTSPKAKSLLDHLCWIVVNCDLLDRPKTIALDEYENLVDQGFAIVSEESATRGSLEENLAMEARWSGLDSVNLDYFGGKCTSCCKCLSLTIPTSETLRSGFWLL